MRLILHFLWTSSVLLGLAGPSFAQNYLTYVDSIKLPDASIWGVISHNQDTLYITTTAGEKIQLRKLDESLQQLMLLKTLADQNDVPVGEKITDHKHLFLNNHLYLTFSITGDRELYLGKFDINGNRVGALVTVPTGSMGTNDMILVSDGNELSIVWGPSGFNHQMKKYDLTLNEVDAKTLTTNEPWPQLAGGYFKDNQFYVFAGSETQEHLSVYHWNTDWTPKTPWRETLIQSTNGIWHFFATGIQYDTNLNRWYIAYALFDAPHQTGDENWLSVAVFDDNFTLLEDQVFSPLDYDRPHSTLLNGNLYITYDKGGQGVFLKKFQVQQGSTASVATKHLSPKQLHCFPNPSNGKVRIVLPEEIPFPEILKVMDIHGHVVQQQQVLASTITLELKTLPSGVYFLEVGEHRIKIVLSQ